MNLADEIFRRADPGLPALLGSENVSYAELGRRSAEVAGRLRANGAEEGSRIGLRCRDGADHIILALGILRAGCCLVPLAPELTSAECAEIISRISLAGIVSCDRDEGTVRFSAGEVTFSYSATGLSDAVLDQRLGGGSPAFIRFSSGTTGDAKGILLNHPTLRERIEAANAGLGITPGDRVLWALPMSHHFAVSIMLYLWNGAAIVLAQSHLPGDLLAAARDRGATVFYGAPCHYQLFTSGEDAGYPAWPTLRLAVSTTAPLTTAAAERFEECFGLHPVQALGLMEVGLPLINRMSSRQRPLSVGTVQPGFEAEIRSEDGRVCGNDEPGELFLRGPGMFDAYIYPWKTREEVTGAGGWFSTGDIASADDQGFITLVGRTKSIISVGGLKFFPEEVEGVLRSQSGVSEVRVRAAEHPSLGSVPVAEVVSEPGRTPEAGELLKACRKELARFKVPVEIRIVRSIPKTPSGKIRRT